MRPKVSQGKNIHVISHDFIHQTFMICAVDREFLLEVKLDYSKINLLPKNILPRELPYWISSEKVGVMMPCFPGNSVRWPESVGIYFHGGYLNSAGSPARMPAERHMRLHYELQSSCTRNLKIWILSMVHLTGWMLLGEISLPLRVSIFIALKWKYHNSICFTHRIDVRLWYGNVNVLYKMSSVM